MNWIFEAYASVYQTATGMGRSDYCDVAPAKGNDGERHDSKSKRR